MNGPDWPDALKMRQSSLNYSSIYSRKVKRALGAHNDAKLITYTHKKG